eukprot:1306055-Pyramimonas_sp.AAC.1
MKVTSSHPLVGRRLCAAMGSSGYNYVSALEVLGIEIGSGRALRFTRHKSPRSERPRNVYPDFVPSARQ